MRKILFYDTETTGTPANYKAPFTDSANWPRMVQIGYIVCTEDGKILREVDQLVRPAGFTIPSQATAIHGITTEIALEKGLDLIRVVAEFMMNIKDVDLVVGHNEEFDYNIVAAEWHRLGRPCAGTPRPRFCTMKSTVKFCALPNGKGGHKWPKLQELYTELFGTDFDNAHNAFADITATKDCFFELIKRKVFTLDKIIA
jgi:DNA polymerase III epsilon subunit-like protein